MKSMNATTAEFIMHYARELKNDSIVAVLQKGAVETEEEAKVLLDFLESMCDRVKLDSKSNVVVLRQPVHTTDAEKVCNVVCDYIEGLGFGHLVKFV